MDRTDWMDGRDGDGRTDWTDWTNGLDGWDADFKKLRFSIFGSIMFMIFRYIF